MSLDCTLLAACTDRSRVIVFKAFTSKQLRNLYGAVIDTYDVRSVCFSLDRSFIYTSSSLSAVRRGGEGEGKDLQFMRGEVAIFEVRTGELVLQLQCHGKAVRCMHRHPHA